MKKIVAMLLALLMLLPLAACSSSLEAETATATPETKAEEKKTEQNKEDPLKKTYGPYDLPEGFSAGFARVCVSPSIEDFPVMTNGGSEKSYGYSLKSDLYVTCVAVSDGENVALLYGFDMKFIDEYFEKQGKKLLQEKFGIPAENAFFNATHSHTAPHGEGTAVTKYIRDCLNGIVTCADEAMRDLAVTRIYTGRGDTTGLAFVRRYLMPDGTYMGIHSANASAHLQPVAHESEADPELRTIRFDRGDKKDIVMVNWQCHVASDASFKIGGRGVVSADLVDKIRFTVEEDLDVHCAYFNGAAGNINMHSKIEGEQKCANTDEVGTAAAQVVKEALKNETEVQGGTIKGHISTVTCTVRKDVEERRAAHNAADEAATVKQTYYPTGVQSKYDEMHLSERAGLPATQDIPLYAISFGDIAFAGGSYEMCDGSGMEIRAGVPYQTTFSCGYTGGANGYMPTDDMFPHGEYEVYSCRYVSGTAEMCVAELVRVLTEMKSAS